jgi:hypothetical protein
MNNTKLPLAILLLFLLNTPMPRCGVLDDSVSAALNLSESIDDYLEFEYQSIDIYFAAKLEIDISHDSLGATSKAQTLRKSFDRMAEINHDSYALVIVQSLNNPEIVVLPQCHLWYRVNSAMFKYAIFAGQIMRMRDYQLIRSTYGRANSPRLVRDADESAMGLLFAGNLTKEMSRQIALNFQLGYREMQNSYQQDRLGNVIMLDRSLVRKYSTGTFWEVSLSYRIFGQ